MVDINLKVPAIEKLLDYAASGIGAIAGPMLATRRARKEAEAKLITAKAEADSLKLIAQAQSEARQFLLEPGRASSGMLEIDAGSVMQRIQFQEQKRQANIAATVQDTATELGDKQVPEHEPDPDWTARFFDCVQDVSSEDMRKLWAKVLSGEVQGPGSTSLRTLDILKNMTAKDAAMFQELCSYVIHDFVFKSDETETMYPSLSYGNLLLLQDAGLINADSTLVKIFRFNQSPNYTHLPYQSWILRISASDQTNKIHVPDYLLTPAGTELLGFAECTPQTDYLRSFSRFLHNENCELSFARVAEVLPDGRVRPTDFLPIEPDDQTSGDSKS